MASVSKFLPGGLLPRPLPRLLLLTLVLACALPPARSLTVTNSLRVPIKLVQVPGCCTPCGWIDPPPGLECYIQFCVRCPIIPIDAGVTVTLNKKVGPYPLPHFKVDAEELIYCVAEDDLKHLTEKAKLTVGPGKCRNGLQGTVTPGVEGLPICLPLCPGTGK